MPSLLARLLTRRRPTAAPADPDVVHTEQAKGSVALTGYRAPGLRQSGGRSAVGWTITATRRRLLIDGTGNKIRRLVDIAWDDHRAVDALKASIDERRRVVITFDAAVLYPDRSGRVSIRIRSAAPDELLGLITSHQTR